MADHIEHAPLKFVPTAGSQDNHPDKPKWSRLHRSISNDNAGRENGATKLVIAAFGYITLIVDLQLVITPRPRFENRRCSLFLVVRY